MQGILTWLSIGGGFIAAGLWLIASLVKVKHPEGEGGLIWKEGSKTYSIGHTFISANKWNAWAAGVTAGAVLLQAIAQALFMACACLPGIPTH